MLPIKDQIQNWVFDSWRSARKTWLNPVALLHGLRWIELSPGQARLTVLPNWLGFHTTRFTGSLTLACELAVDEALKLCDRLMGVDIIFVGSTSEFYKSNRGVCEVRFKVGLDDIERLRLQILEKKTLSHEFVVTLWTPSGQQIGMNRLNVELQLRPYLTAN